ncbi:probable cytochrome P450 6d4 [Toxorhynchites rutilus septentrionalis]|uniref:probable cytochrome P450 6d4 n=1 Tax=Toxorhynchites rutilus septentrionalis TaxID=329112 RepID=UPI002478F89F|nr:probable cytochrome P450 6d4 [Toxorhynchites rutilus septentrionalis]
MLLYTIILFGVLLYALLKYIYSFWDRHGLPNLRPHIPFGNLQTVALKTESFGVAINNLYWQSKGALVGIYLFFRPAILIRDPHLAHRIMTSDFSSFHDRGVYCNEEGDPFSANLFGLSGKRWRSLRNKLTPTFSSGQLRGMLPTILEVGDKLKTHLQSHADKGEVVEMRDLLSRFVLEIIASVFFGVEANCIHDPNDSFRAVLRNAQRDRLSTNFRTAAIFVCPGLLKLVRTTSLPTEVIEFVTQIVTHQIEQRERNGVTRKDFIQQVIDLRQEDNKSKELSLSLGQCAANVFLFYVAGSETSTAAIMFSLHELTQNPELMGRLQAEIDETLKKTNGEINYDAVNGMKLLDMCVKETLRKYPGLPILNRECTEEYRVPESDVIIRKGTQVVIPLLGYSMDAKYFPEPDRYYPERFEKDNKNYDEKAYYPFGEGPRNCIGFRMGAVVSKIALIMLLSNFNFEAVRGPKIDFVPSSVGLVPIDGMPLKITKRAGATPEI